MRKPKMPAFLTSDFALLDPADQTKELQFDVSNLTTGTVNKIIVPQGTMYSQYGIGSVNNTASETTLTSTARGSLTVPANFFDGGKVLKISATGDITYTGAPSLRLKIKKGTTVLLDTTALTGWKNTSQWFMEAVLIGQSTTGVTTVGWISNLATNDLTGTPIVFGSFAVNTTISASSEALDITAQWGTADILNKIRMFSSSVQIVI